MYPLAARRLIGGLGQNVVVGGLPLPYTFDPSALGDGALPSEWSGATFLISSGVVVNTPELGDELFAGGNMDGTFTDGLNENLTKAGSPTVAESADAQAGSKAQSFIGAAANNALYQAIAKTAGRWYIGSSYGKRTAGANGTTCQTFFQISGINDWSDWGEPHDSAAYAQLSCVYFTKGTGNFFYYPVKELGATGDTVLIDTVSTKEATSSTLFASVDTGQTDGVVKVRGLITTAPQRVLGCVARLDSASNPENFLLAYKIAYRGTGWLYVGLLEFVAGVPAALITPTYMQAADNAAHDLEIRMSGSTVSLWYNNVQADTDKPTNVLTGTRRGYFSTGGGNSLNRFFVE